MNEQRVKEIQEATMREKTKEQLEKISKAKSGWEPEAIEAAKRELEERGVEHSDEIFDNQRGELKFKPSGRIAIILKSITTLIAIGVVLGLILNFEVDYRICGDHMTGLFAGITRLVIGLILVSTIILWWRPRIASIFFILSSVYILIGFCLVDYNLELALASVVCGVLLQMVGWRKDDMQRVPRVLKSFAIVIAIGLILFPIWDGSWDAYYLSTTYVYAFRALIVLAIAATIAIWRNLFIGGIGFILLGLSWLVIVLSGLFPQLNGYLQDTHWVSIWCIVCGTLALVAWVLESVIKDEQSDNERAEGTRNPRS